MAEQKAKTEKLDRTLPNRLRDEQPSSVDE
jgi:hypothetical protein